jgi:hypothetical protein
MLATLPVIMTGDQTMRKFALAAAVLATAGLSAPLLADDDRNRLNVPAADWKSAAEIKDRMVSAGYTVREIETDDGVYEVDVVDKDGTKMELHVHPATGEILRGYDD